MQTNEIKNEKKTGELKKSFTSRQFKSGGFAFLYCAIALALIIFLNLIVGTLPVKFTQFDLTSNKLYTLGEQSKELVSNIDEDVTFYFVTTDEARDTIVEQLIKNYAALTDHIKIVEIDPTVNLAFVNQYPDLTYTNSIVVESANRSRVVDYYAIYQNTYNVDYTTGGYNTTTVFDGENQITSAIDYVVSDELPVVYVISGNGEIELPDSFRSSIERQNVTVEDLSLMTTTVIPEDAAAIILNSPANDLTDAEYKTLLAYLENGGSMLLFTDYQNGRLSRLNDLMENYGVTPDSVLVVEGDDNHCFPEYAYYLLPDRQEHEITAGLTGSGYYVMMPLAHGIEELPSRRNALNIVPLLTTSDKAYGKLDANVTEYENGDEMGPFTVGMAIDETVNDVTTRIAWYSTSYVLAEDVDKVVGGSNSVMLLNSIKWLMGDESSGLVIDAKALNTERLTVTAAQSTMWAIILMIVVPLAFIAAGIVIFIRRRKR